MEITVDRQMCIGAGMCTLTAPEVFDQDDDGTVVLLDGAPPAQHEAAAQEAEQVCPSGAITLLRRKS
ncbi:ferredoxin [Nocardia sp. NPDC052566]|uniref:ferredoxin n=1 Tax=Nocardia sp. NPDC052566 TaxID=3364330 RepID=UPI0037CBDE5A